MASGADPPEHKRALPSGEATVLLPGEDVPSIAPLVRALAPASQPPSAAPPSSESLASLASLAPGTAADALRTEEIDRTRLFIRMGWLLSLAAIATLFVVPAPREIAVLFTTGLVIGMVVSYGYHRAFAEPRNYTERALMTLSVICVINGHLAVLLYGAYTASTLMIMIGIHFVARTEAERVARWIFASAVVSYAAISIAIGSGAVADPGVFASDRPMSRATLATGSCFVLGAFWLAYYTARQFRHASLAAIDDLQRATRLASQREALMDELRADLERALRAGPGRHTDQTVGRFRLGAVLGRGAMGEVYEASDLASGEPAAVKLLVPGLFADPAQRARFGRELAATRALASPHVVRVLDGSADAVRPFLAMERLHGQTLAELFRREPRLTGGALRALCRQVGAAIDLAAAAGIVHRDLKPQNLFRTDDGTWKVLDFGVAQVGGDGDRDPAPSGERALIGTPRYMAPEQARGQIADTRADLYALGAVVYRCATGRHPFDAAEPRAVLYAIAHRMPARPSGLAELPRDFDRWCAIALAKPPEARFASGAAMAEALDHALRGELGRALRERADRALRDHPWDTDRPGTGAPEAA
ncbi:MAG TPA: serine/threonine-protein kinase [Kofleriaceae bacterium]|nr:serine/threonine-protein kinase [Kofleriaceae bacterium]